MLVSPSCPCKKCNSIFFELQENGNTVCANCKNLEEYFSLEDVCPGITNKIIFSCSNDSDDEE